MLSVDTMKYFTIILLLHSLSMTQDDVRVAPEKISNRVQVIVSGNHPDAINNESTIIFDNSKNRCFKERNYFFDDKTSNNNNNNVNYEYYDRDCESLRQRGHDVYCTYDKDSINDDSLYFNLDRTIDLEKKRYKTCYDEDCMDTSNNKNKN